MLEIEDFTYTYPQGTAPVLTNVTARIERGTLTLVTGPTGAGKTTLCLAMAGILTHEYGGSIEGRVTICGRDVGAYRDMGEIGQHIGMVFDDPDSQLIFTTVEEEILSSLENQGLAQSEVQRRLEEILEATDTASLRNRAPHTLSGGQKQRVTIAATLAGNRDCIILDEPTSELDAASTALIIRLLTTLRDEGRTVLVVEHKLGALAGCADQTIYIENGQIMAHTGDPGLTPASEKPAPLPLNSDGDPVITVSGLVHRYDGVEALSGVDLSIRKGELVAVTGENGSGKTTLAKHLNGLLKPTGGDVRVCGMDTVGTPIPQLTRKVGLVFQNPDTMLFEETVEKEILFGLENTGCRNTSERIQAALTEAGLLNCRGRYPRSMSRGERQRLAIACVLAMEPEVIILDEPTTGLDHQEAEKVMNLLHHLHETGHTILMISHDLDMVGAHAGRIIKMEQGAIVADTGGIS